MPTLILGSALDILEAGSPPRAKFLNYPLGFEAGRFQDKVDQLQVVRDAIAGFDTMNKPQIEPIEVEWQAGWDMVNQREAGKLDQRSPRDTIPQYQTQEDKILAEQLDHHD